MFQLKFSKENITKQELNQIEKRFKEYLQDKKFVGGPEFNVLGLCRTDLFALVLNIFIRLNIHTTLKMNISQVLDFLIDVAENYTEAPYHSFYHATDIVTMLYYFVSFTTDKLTDLDITFLMVAALCHDIGHPGLNNAFQKNTKSELAIKYNGKSILEAFSVDLTIELLKKHNIQHAQLNETIRDLILSTDMEFHSDIVSQQKQLISNSNNNNSKQDRLSFSRILLHATDVSNMARPWNISKQWSDLLIKEFFNQGDQERKLNMTISPGMDRNLSLQRNISLKFGEIIFPFFQSLVSLLPKSHVLLDFLASNRIQWTADCLDFASSIGTTAAVTANTTTSTAIATRKTSSTLTRKRKYQPTAISNDTITAQLKQPIIIRHKRIRLGLRSLSYPTILNHHQPTHHCCHTSINDNKLLPLVNFKKSFSSLYDSNHLLESSSSTIVLYHPYDQ